MGYCTLCPNLDFKNITICSLAYKRYTQTFHKNSKMWSIVIINNLSQQKFALHHSQRNSVLIRKYPIYLFILIYVYKKFYNIYCTHTFLHTIVYTITIIKKDDAILSTTTAFISQKKALYNEGEIIKNSALQLGNKGLKLRGKGRQKAGGTVSSLSKTKPQYAS